MPISTASDLTPRPEAAFFAAPQSTLQRQYEALRAFFVDDLPSAEVARRFSYSPGSFRVLCHQFRHDPQGPRSTDRPYSSRLVDFVKCGPLGFPRNILVHG